MSSKLGDLPLPVNSGGGGRYFMNSSGTLFTAVAFYIIVSISATFINKLLFTFSEYKFPYPFFTVFFQLVITFLFLTLWRIFQPM